MDILKTVFSLLGFYWAVQSRFENTEDKKKAMAEYREAIKKATDKEKPQTKDLEQWFTKYMS